MNILFRFFALLCLTSSGLISITGVYAQKFPDTTRLLRFPTTNDTQIVFCYAGEIYTVGKDGGMARRLTSGPGYSSLRRFSPAAKQIALNSECDGNTAVYI